MTQVKSDWPANRYRRRMSLRLRRRRYNQTEGAAQAGTTVAVEADPPPIDAAANAEIEALREQGEKLRDQLLRMQAEFENFRRRARKEKEEIQATAGAEVLEKILPVADNFGRALKSPATSLESFVQGVQMIHTHFLGLLREVGLEPVQALGETFDPNRHEAVAVDNSGEHPENQVVEVLQDGYMLKGRLIRPAMVKVARS